MAEAFEMGLDRLAEADLDPAFVELLDDLYLERAAELEATSRSCPLAGSGEGHPVRG